VAQRQLVCNQIEHDHEEWAEVAQAGEIALVVSAGQLQQHSDDDQQDVKQRD